MMLGLLQLEWEPKCVNLCPDVGAQVASVMHNRPAFLTINRVFSSVLISGIFVFKASLIATIFFHGKVHASV